MRPNMIKGEEKAIFQHAQQGGLAVLVRRRERERESYRKRKSINNYSVWVYFPTQKQIIKILIRMTTIKTVYQDSHRSPG